MEKPVSNEEFRWIIVKGMLDDFPALRERVRNYLATQAN